MPVMYRVHNEPILALTFPHIDAAGKLSVLILLSLYTVEWKSGINVRRKTTELVVLDDCLILKR